MRSSGGRLWYVDCGATVGGLLDNGCGRGLLVLAYVVWILYGDVGFVVVSGVFVPILLASPFLLSFCEGRFGKKIEECGWKFACCGVGFHCWLAMVFTDRSGVCRRVIGVNKA